MQANTERRLAGLKDKVPDIQKTLDTVRFLQKREVIESTRAFVARVLIVLQPEAEPLETTFELNDTLYAKAHVSTPEEVYIWLGVHTLLLDQPHQGRH